MTVKRETMASEGFDNPTLKTADERRREYIREYRRVNAERLKDYGAAYRVKNAERLKDYDEAYRVKNAERIRTAAQTREARLTGKIPSAIANQVRKYCGDCDCAHWVSCVGSEGGCGRPGCLECRKCNLCFYDENNLECNNDSV